MQVTKLTRISELLISSTFSVVYQRRCAEEFDFSLLENRCSHDDSIETKQWRQHCVVAMRCNCTVMSRWAYQFLPSPCLVTDRSGRFNAPISPTYRAQSPNSHICLLYRQWWASSWVEVAFR